MATTRVVLHREDFRELVQGRVAHCEGAMVILADIGYLAMCHELQLAIQGDPSFRLPGERAGEAVALLRAWWDGICRARDKQTRSEGLREVIEARRALEAWCRKDQQRKDRPS